MKATASVVSRSWRYARHIRRSLALILLAVCLAIPMQGCDDTKNPTDDDPAAEGSALLPESELTSDGDGEYRMKRRTTRPPTQDSGSTGTLPPVSARSTQRSSVWLGVGSDLIQKERSIWLTDAAT